MLPIDFPLHVKTIDKMSKIYAGKGILAIFSLTDPIERRCKLGGEKRNGKLEGIFFCSRRSGGKHIFFFFVLIFQLFFSLLGTWVVAAEEEGQTLSRKGQSMGRRRGPRIWAPTDGPTPIVLARAKGEVGPAWWPPSPPFPPSPYFF